MNHRNSLSRDGDAIYRVGLGDASYDADQTILIEARSFGRDGVYNCTATGTLRLPVAALQDVIRSLMADAAKDAGTPKSGAPHIVAGIADALTALRVAVEARKGVETRAGWWRPQYFHLVEMEHRRMWPRTPIQNPHTQPKATPTSGAPTAHVVSIDALRRGRQAREARLAREAAAREAERARVKAALTVEPSGQLALAMPEQKAAQR
jgi:hypothetical protein